MQKYTKKAKKRKDKSEYFKKAHLFFDFSRIINNFAHKITSYEKEIIHHPITDGSFCVA